MTALATPRLLIPLVLFAAASCATFKTPSAEQAGGCHRHRLGSLPRLTSDYVQSLAGRYDVVLVARSGEMAGNVSRGTLTLEPTDSTRRMLGPLTGIATLDFSTVSPHGGVAPGRPAPPPLSTIVDAKRGDLEIVLVPQRIESDRLGERVVDRGTQLRVDRAAGSELTGSWSTGGVVTFATGYFCATRTDR